MFDLDRDCLPAEDGRCKNCQQIRDSSYFYLTFVLGKINYRAIIAMPQDKSNSKVKILHFGANELEYAHESWKKRI